MHESGFPRLSECQAMQELFRVMWPWDGAAKTWAEQFAADEAEFQKLEGASGSPGYELRFSLN